MKIAAVIVTHNRLHLLKECINGVRNQTRKLDEIIVVNNGSTDGTKEWLEQQEDLTIITQPNLGSSGGQYTGIKFAYEKGYDWIWCMDDDGYPTNNCLENLTKSDKFLTCNCLNSLVIDPLTKRLSFKIPNVKSYNKYLDYYFELTDDPEIIKGLSINGVYSWGMFFNSTLLPYEIIKEIGLPKKDFFIWGDEVEYFYRIKRKFNVFIICDSIFYHPSKKSELKIQDDLKHRFYIRNYVYINNTYRKHSFFRNFLLFFRIIQSGKISLIKYFFNGFKLK